MKGVLKCVPSAGFLSGLRSINHKIKNEQQIHFKEGFVICCEQDNRKSKIQDYLSIAQIRIFM